MKLYEFSYTDNLNQPESEVIENILEFLESESIEQGWAPNFTFHRCQKDECLPSGEKRYHFEVTGRYMEQVDDDAGFEPAGDIPNHDVRQKILDGDGK